MEPAGRIEANGIDFADWRPGPPTGRSPSASTASAEDCAFVERLWRDWSPGLEIDRDDMGRIRAMLSRPEVLQAATTGRRWTPPSRRRS